MRRTSLALGLCLAAACGAPGPLRTGAGPAATASVSSAPASAASALPPLADRERALAEALKRDVVALAVKIGERNVTKKWELASAADFLSESIEDAGLAVGREGYEVDGVAALTIDTTLRGGERGDEVIVVGAHYDSAAGSPGANDNATGVAALLALARELRGVPFSRTLRLAWFPNEEPPYFHTEQMGSLVYARHLAGRGERVVAMISLESLGCYRDEPGSQRVPPPLAGRYSTVGNFVAVVGDERSRALVDRFGRALELAATVPVARATLPVSIAGSDWSDHWSFWQIGVPAIMITDTAVLRDPEYHRVSDGPEHIDYERFARATAGLITAVAELAR